MATLEGMGGEQYIAGAKETRGASRWVLYGTVVASMVLLPAAAFIARVRKVDDALDPHAAHSQSVECAPILARESDAAPAVRGLPVLEPMTTEVLRRRSIEAFPSGYLTFMAIIQGVALGLLAVQAVALYTTSPEPSEAMWFRVDIAGQLLVGFASVVIVTYEYLWFTTIMRWTPTFADTLVPYMLGAGEVILPLLMGRDGAWWIAFSIFLVTGAAALAHTKHKCLRPMFDETRQYDPYHLAQRLLTKLIVCLLAVAVGSGVVGGIVLGDGSPHPMAFTALISWVPLLVGTAMAAFSEVDLNKIYDVYNVPRHNWRRAPVVTTETK